MQQHLKPLRISQCYYKYTKVFPKNKIKNKSYTLRLLMLWVSSFTELSSGTQGAVEKRLPVVFMFCKTMTILGAATMRVPTSANTHQQSNGERIL